MDGFIFNKKHCRYEGRLPGVFIILDAEKCSGEIAGRALENFRKYEAAFSDADRRARRFAAENLLSLANEWREDAKAPSLTADEFTEMISVNTVAFNGDGTSEIYLDDGEVFGGHSITVNIDAAGRITAADIAG